MKMLRCLPIIFGIIVFNTDAAVTVIPGNSLANIETFICGTSENVICKISPFGGTMTWQIGSTLAANCISGTCTVNNLFSADYSFLFNTTTGVFNLIIKQVTVSVNGTTFSCDDGLTSNATQANVKVTDDFETAIDETTFDISRNQTQMKITTGCLKENTASKVNIFWYFLKVNGSGSRKRFLNTSKGQETTSEDNSACEADPDCGSPGFTQISSELSITEDGVGETYRFEVDIDFGIPERNKRVMFNVNLKLNFETSSYLLPCYIGILIAYLFFLVEWQIYIYGYALLSCYKINEENKCFSILHVCSHVPLLGIIPAAGIQYYLHKKEVKLNITGINSFLTFIACIPVFGISFIITGAIKKTTGFGRWLVVFICIIVLFLDIFIAIFCPVLDQHEWYYPFVLAVIALVLKWFPLTYNYFLESGLTGEHWSPGTVWRFSPIIGVIASVFYLLFPVSCRNKVGLMFEIDLNSNNSLAENKEENPSSSSQMQGENDVFNFVSPLPQNRNNLGAAEASENKRKPSDLPETHRRNSTEKLEACNSQNLVKDVLPPINRKSTA